VQCEGAKLRIIKRVIGTILDELEENLFEKERLMSMLDKDEEEGIK
jgi:hypothetical protein